MTEIRAGTVIPAPSRSTAKHLWVGESYVRIVMYEVVRRVNPAALVPPEMTLPVSWTAT